MTAPDKSYFDSKFSDLSKKVDNIDRGVYGDKSNNHRGLVERDQDKEVRIKSLEKKWDRAVWIAAGSGMAGFGISKLIESIIKQINI